MPFDSKEYNKSYYAKHRDSLILKQRAYRRNNKESVLKQVKEYNRRNPETRKSAILKYEFGITIDDYYKLLELQNGGCAICGNQQTRKGVKYLAVDHDHASGTIRGLLCDRCNRGLGFFKDSPELLNRASAYLQRYKSH